MSKDLKELQKRYSKLEFEAIRNEIRASESIRKGYLTLVKGAKNETDQRRISR